MSSLLPPSPSISPAPNGTVKNARASMGPSRNAQGLSLNSPRPGGMPGSARPTSELLGTGGLHQTPEGKGHSSQFFFFQKFNSSPAEALDQWFENLQNYEVTLVRMAQYGFRIANRRNRKKWRPRHLMSISKKN
jgi:hypothetical protein